MFMRNRLILATAPLLEVLSGMILLIPWVVTMEAIVLGSNTE